MALQLTFKENYLKRLKDAASSGASVNHYIDNTLEIDKTQLKRLVGVEHPEGLAEKLEQTYSDDFRSAILVYEAYENISPLLASSEAFWAYLTHADLSGYVQRRWPDIRTVKNKTDYILDHWFFGSQGVYRNAVATLWWGVYLTADRERDNKYELTEVLFKNYSFRIVHFGNYSLIRHREAMIGILEFLRDNPEITGNSFEYRGRFLSKYFNQLGAVKQLSYLDRNFFRRECENIKGFISDASTRDTKQIELLLTEASKSYDKTLYSLDGKRYYSKGKFVWMCVRKILERDENLTFDEIESLLPLRGYGNKTLLRRSEWLMKTPDQRRRYFCKPDEIFTDAKGVEFLVSTQWTKDNIEGEILPVIEDWLGWKVWKL